ncbi:Cholesterol 24-hydroxylase [Holothuria leucospilota]|uniref:Cholesterol 24-hydroxylase n=1 Tax=Holothuria leucospilota TaxID=206669 RepID=A0A9Q1CIF1_HOLLE|nr:Cholesterol 24-hydroxylase [Holothuria leucospilota]
MLTILILQLALGGALAVGILAALVIVMRISYIHYKYRHLPGPPIDSFLGGNTRFAKAVIEDRGTFMETFFELHEQYGPVFKLISYHIVFIGIADPKAVKELLMNSKYLKPEFNYRLFVELFGERFGGHGLVSECNHERWEQHRRILNPAFHRKYLMELTDIFNDSASRLTDFLAAQADGKTEVNMKDALERVTLDVIAKAGFSMDGDMISERNAFSDAIAFVIAAASRSQIEPFFRFDPRPGARKYRAKARATVRFLRKTGTDLIKQRLQDQKDGKDLPKDILSYIIKTAMIEEHFQLEEMVDEFMTFFGAGQETTSNLLAFTFIALGQNPHVMEKLQKEVDAVIGDKEEILYEDIMQLEYMMMVLKETLRLFPPVGGTTRISSEIFEVGGYKIPPNTMMFVLSFVMSRQEQFFKNPMTFDPERFRREEDRPLYAYFPFSLGPRSCIGQQFALIEARVVLAKLLQRLKFKLVPDQDFTLMERLTLKPRDDCRHYLSLRE